MIRKINESPGDLAKLLENWSIQNKWSFILSVMSGNNQEFRMRLVCYLILLFFSSLSHADLTLSQPLSFGTIAVVDNSTVQNITIDEFGNYSISSGLRTLESGAPAIFLASNFPGNLQLFISSLITQPGTSSDVFSPEQFTLTNLYVVSSVVTGPDGTAEIIVGGRLETSGSGSTNFVDTNYNSNLRLTINY